MGYGDALIAAGLAQEKFAEAPELGPVAIVNHKGEPRWRREWDGNPAIRPPNDPGIDTAPRIMLDREGHLPYHPWRPEMTWRVRDHRAAIYLTRQELKMGLAVRQKYGSFILIEPPGHDRKNTNRKWHGWAKLAKRLRQQIALPILQLHRSQADRLPGIPGILHGSFREACAILKYAELGVLTEGGITIAAATVGTPAVVIWGGCVPCENFGYPEHTNIVDDDPRTPCGSNEACDHCTQAWQRLTPDYVAAVVVERMRTLERRTA